MSEMTYVLMGNGDVKPYSLTHPQIQGFNGFNFSPVADKTFNSVILYFNFMICK